MHVAADGVRQARRETHDGLFVVLVQKRRTRHPGKVSRHGDRRVLHEIAADAGQIGDQGNSQRGELGCRTDAAAHQQGGAVDRARANDDLRRMQIFGRTVLSQQSRAVCARAVEAHAIDHQVGSDRQVGALANGIAEITNRGWDALTVRAYRDRTDVRAVFPWAVLVGLASMPVLLQRAEHRPHERRHALPSRALDSHGTLAAVARAAEVAIGFEFAKIGQAGKPVPAVGTECFPFVVVGGGATVGHQRIDRRAAAENPGLLVAARRTRGGLRGARAHERRQAPPDVVDIEIGAARIAASNGGGHIGPRQVSAGLDQADVFIAIFR